ncbi:olfactory receptor 14A2-like [Tachyglossus aculeatus]|uniref:olfactory receptor 14A2-like n=1 Tax=Tachyglossus aculeatus TaxID=9261 RepID=UPI0018F2C6E0|nr:olfactory receptor 14A2-like [Tachyglossus aculeatus]
MESQFCLQRMPNVSTMVAASWFNGVLYGVWFAASSFSLSFCGSNVVQQFFCDVPSLLKISCSEDHVAINVSVTGGVALGVVCFVFIIISYVRIFHAVLKMPASESRAKAFSTCLPHLAVVTVFLSTGSFDHLKPVSDSPSTLDLLMSVFYTVVPPDNALKDYFKSNNCHLSIEQHEQMSSPTFSLSFRVSNVFQ